MRVRTLKTFLDSPGGVDITKERMWTCDVQITSLGTAVWTSASNAMRILLRDLRQSSTESLVEPAAVRDVWKVKLSLLLALPYQYLTRSCK